MMNRKLSILLTAALGMSLATLPVYAQQGNQRQGDKTERRQRMSMEARFAKELSLTPAQQKQINPILKKQGEQMRAIFKNDKLTPEQKRAQAQKIMASLPEKINKYLTKTQRVKLQQMIERRKNFKGRGKGNRGQKPGTPSRGN